MDENYHFDKWAVETIRGRRIFNFGYRLWGDEVEQFNLAKSVNRIDNQDRLYRTYLFRSAANPKNEMVRVDITEGTDWQFAQQNLLQYLKECMRPDIPRGTKQLAQLGDINYVGREDVTDIPAAISFTRGNLHLIIRSVEENTLDVSDLALALDNALVEPPGEMEYTRRQIRKLEPDTVSVEADVPFALIEDMKNIASDDIWLKILVPDGELKMKENTLFYVSPEAGRKKIMIFAITILMK